METHGHAREGNPKYCLEEGKRHSMSSPPQVSNLTDLLAPHHAATGCHNTCIVQTLEPGMILAASFFPASGEGAGALSKGRVEVRTGQEIRRTNYI